MLNKLNIQNKATRNLHAHKIKLKVLLQCNSYFVQTISKKKPLSLDKLPNTSETVCLWSSNDQ